MENITLYFRQGSSDKIYQAGIVPKDGGYVVNFAYGRRGATLATGTKTQAPVAHDEAKRIYDKLIAEDRQGLHARRGRHALSGHRQGQCRHGYPLPVTQSHRGKPSGPAHRRSRLVDAGEA
jgi:hypothetical protein